MLDHLLLIYGLKDFDKRLLNRLFSKVTLFSNFFTIIKVILLIRIEDNINITLIKLMFLLTAISSLMSYVYITIKSKQILELKRQLKCYKTSSTSDNFSTFFSTSFAIIVMISIIILTFLFRNNYHHMKKLFEEPIEHFKYKKFLQLNTDFGIILDCIFNYGWKIILQTFHYNINREYLSILIIFNNQLNKRLNIQTADMVDSTHRTINEFLHIKYYFNDNMGVIKYFIKSDITIFFFYYILLFIDSIKELNIYALCLIVMFYSYYRFVESISHEVMNNEKSIQLNWRGAIIYSKTKIHLNALKESTSDRSLKFTVTDV
jgi:hypothetical protein